MFEIGFTELIIIGVVALIVIGPERLPKVARTAGHLYGRMQRYVSTVRSDISREIKLYEMRKAGQELSQSVESVASEVEKQATVVDDYLRNATDTIGKEMAVTGGERPVAKPARKQPVTEQPPQQALPLDDPNLDTPETPSATKPGEVDAAGNPGPLPQADKSA